MNNASKPYWPLIPILFLLTGLMIWMSGYMPPSDLAPSGYSSVILAFEFILNHEDLTSVLSPLSADQLDGLDMVNYIDFGYMVVYASLLAGFTYITQKIDGPKYLVLGIALAVVALFSDLFENIQLLDLTAMFRLDTSEGYESVISNLFIFTWMKWGALALAMSLLVPTLFRRGLFSKIIAVLLGIPFIMLLACAGLGTPAVIDKFGSSIVFGFLAIAVYIIAYRRQLTEEKKT